MFDQAQLRKGTLEGCILKIIDREPTYGYAIATTLRDSGFADLTEGTLYPLLLRLERKGLIGAEYRAGSGGQSTRLRCLAYRCRLAAALCKRCLMLLGSPPDMVHRLPTHGACICTRNSAIQPCPLLVLYNIFRINARGILLSQGFPRVL